MSNFNFVTDSRLAKAVYDSNNRNDTATIDGWKPIKVENIASTDVSPTFGAQLYENGGQYKVVFRGTEGNLQDWIENFKYGTYQDSPEFKDTVRFMARAVVQVAREEGKQVSEIIDRFTTTGHSQGGFEAQLASVLFKVKGTSLDGMGALGVASQFRDALTQVMKEEGVGDLVGNHALSKTDFETRQYTTVGFLGRHAGSTDGAWSWSLSKIGIAVSPQTAGVILAVGLRAHMIDDIIANEERRARDPVWRVIGDASDVFNSPDSLTNQLIGDWGKVMTAWLGDGMPALTDNPAARALLNEFFADHSDQQAKQWVDSRNKTFHVVAQNGDSLELLSDGRFFKRHSVGMASVETEFDRTGNVKNQVSVQMGGDSDGVMHVLISRKSKELDITVVLDAVTNQTISGITKQLDAQGNVLQSTVYKRLDNGTLDSTVYGPNNQVLYKVNSQTFNDGTAIEIKTENGQQYMRATDTDNKTSDWKNLATGQTQTAEQRALGYENQLYSDMAGFLNALRGKDKVNQLLYGAKIAIDYQMKNGATEVKLGDLDLGKTVAGLSATVGIVAGLHALQSDDTQAQLSGAVGLLGSANNLAIILDVTHKNAAGETAKGFLSGAQLGALATAGAVLSIVNLKNLDTMLENGQVGSAVATIYGAWQGAQALSTAYTAATAAGAAEGAFFASMAESAAAAGPAALGLIVASFVLDGLFGKPPPPPMGWAEFTRDASGQLAISTHDANALGAGILQPKMAEILASLNQQLTEANGPQINESGVTIAPAPEAERQLVLVASRLPKLYLQSWPSHEGNGETNYAYYVEMRHPQTGQKYGVQMARQDIAKEYAGLAIAPEALVQKWQADHMAAKFGADETQWKTEGQWTTQQSPVEQQRAALTSNYQEAYQALVALKETQLVADQAGVLQAVNGQTPAQHQASIGAQQAKVDAAYKALVLYSTQHPLGYVSDNADAQGHHSEGVNAQAAAMIVDKLTAADLAKLEATDPEAWQSAWSKAREGASQQWMKAITLDWNGDGKISKWMPSEIAAGSDSRTDGAKKFNVGTMLKDLQGDGFARFDVDGDGYREATEWVAPSDALLGIDRDGNGVIDTASELFNGPSTAFEQRGWASLKYYDSNNDGKITRADAVFKLLRLWVDVNGDGAAGSMETFTLDMDYAGVDMVQLKASLDAAGQQALAALKKLAVGSIDLQTLAFNLADGSTLQAFDDRLKADALGTAVTVDSATKNVTIMREKPFGADPAESVDAETWITLVEDMSVLQELQNSGITEERKTQLRTLAKNYGLDPDAADFGQILKNLVKGGEKVGGSGLPTRIGEADVVVGAGFRIQLEALRIAQANALTVLASDVLSGGLVYTGLSTPIWAKTTTQAVPFDDRYVTSRLVNAGEITSDIPLATAAPAMQERWVLPSNMYSLEQIVKGRQIDGTVAQQAVVVSQKIVNGQTQNVAQQTVQVYTAQAPSQALQAMSVQGEEDERLSLGYLQLEQEARDQLVIAGASPLVSLRLVGVKEVRHGSVVLDDEKGILRFVAESDYVSKVTGDVGFSYVLADESGKTYSRTVNYTLSEVNDAPTVVGETIATLEDMPLLINAADLLANDFDKEYDALQVVGIGRVGMGRATMESNGKIRYVPPSDLYGTTDTVEYLVRDARGAIGVGVIKVTLAAVGDAPTVQSEIIRNAQEDVALRIQAKLLLANDIDPDVDARTGAAPLRITAVSQALHGQAFLDGMGDVIFVPEADYHGKASFSYTVTDPSGLSTVGSAEVDIKAVNDAPVAVGESVNSREDEVLTFDATMLLANDSDVDIDRGEDQRLGLVAVINAVGGTVALVNGKVVFTPTRDHFGQASFDYVVSDNAGGLSQATVKIDLAAVNELPVVPDRKASGEEDRVLIIRKSQLMDGIFDVEDGTNLKVSTSNVQHGKLTLVYDAQLGEDVFTFVPEANYFGSAGFAYTVSDTQGGSSTAQMRIDLAPVNDVPVALTRSYRMQEDAPQPLRIRTSELLAGLRDVEDGSVLSVTVSDQTNGTVNKVWDAGLGEHVYEFRPSEDYNGLAGFIYTVADSQGGSSSAAVQVTVAPVNDAPKFIEGSYFSKWGEENYPIYISESAVLKMFGDIEGDAMWIDASSVRAINPKDDVQYDASTRELVFKPEAYANGVRQIEVAVKDALGARSGAVRLNLNVTDLNYAPRVKAVYFQVAEDGIPDWQRSQDHAMVPIDLGKILARDLVSDPDGDATRVSWVGSPTVGGTSIWLDSANNRICMVLPRHYSGPLQFQYTVTDDKGGNTTQTAYVSVNAVNDVPTVTPIFIDEVNHSLNYRLDINDVEDGRGKGRISVEQSPAQSLLRMGQYQKFLWEWDSMIETEWINVKNHFNISNWIRRGRSQTESFKLKVTDSQGGETVTSGNFWANGYDPIVFDLGSDGLEFTTAKKGVSTFDVDGDGVKDRLAWASGKDAMLVYDYNNDNLVTKFDELAFGSHLSTPDSDIPDLQALAQKEFDANQDGLLDAKDAKWTKFKVWQDKNGNGVVDAGELQTLDQAGVQSIALHANVLNHAYNEDVTVRGFTRVRMSDGRELQAGDARFGVHDPSTDTPTQGTPSTPTTITEGDYNAAQADWQRSHDALMHAGSTQFAGGLSAQKTWINAEYRYVLPDQLFASLPTGQRYVVTQADGSALPVWLRYDADTRTLSGTPGQYQQGLLNLKVFVPGDVMGGADTASGHFVLEVVEYNQAPVLYGDVTLQVAREGSPFSFEVASNLFIDRDASDALNFKATLADGCALPSWLSFDPVHLRFAGTATTEDVGALEITLTASDNAQASASETFTLYVEGINDVPELVSELKTFGLRSGQSSTYVLPLTAFYDADIGIDDKESLTLGVSMADGGALPEWLSYTTATHTLVATLQDGQSIQPLQLRVTATDFSGASVSTFLTVAMGQWGTLGNDHLLGSSVAEYLWGEAGNDQLDGRAGADILCGGQGDDVYVVDVLDTVIEKIGEGSDTVISQVSFVLPENVENLRLQGVLTINGTGNDLANVLIGNGGDNILNGMGGVDALIGGGGNDIYRVDSVSDVIIEDGFGGVDTVESSVTYSLSLVNNVENLRLVGNLSINGTGNYGDNHLFGNAADNVLIGAGGNDVLNGGGGKDILIGGDGSDTYIINDLLAIIVENDADLGVDTVLSSVDFDLSNLKNVENLSLTGSESINGFGNNLNNYLRGNSGNNVLSGGAGNDVLVGCGGIDRLIGGSGDDTYYVNSSSDEVVELAGEGEDTIISSTSFSLENYSNVERLVLNRGEKLSAMK